MDTKVILFLALFSAVFVQENSANPLSIPTLSDILGHVKGSIEALVKDAEEKTQQESADASALLAELQASSQDRIADAQAEALQLTSGLPEKIIAEVAKAGGSPDKILECTKQAQADIDKYGSDAQMALTACVTDKLGEAVMAVTAAVEASQMTANILTDMQSEIQTMCPITNSSDSENTFVQSLCSQNLITAASDKVAEQGEVTASKMKEASDIVKGMSVVQPDLATCFKTKAAEVAAGAQPIIEKIVVCASAAPAMPAAPAPADVPAAPADVPEVPADVPAVPSPDDVPAAPSPDDVPAAPSPDDDPAAPSPDDVPAAPSLFDM